ncbi:MAG: DNA-deoxyinosine glycosylase [bacterium]|nr:DNA-deoxyinosine glycosylase [bacterium]
MVKHPFPPLYDENSRILILGSFPSVKSREQRFFYGHPQNRFWRVTSAVFGCPVPQTIEEKSAFLHENHIALWDVVASCEITGSSDSSIKDVIPNDLRPILDAADIKSIFVNGRAAEKYYIKYQEQILGRKAVYLPSTSPANAAMSQERLIEKWRIAAEV